MNRAPYYVSPWAATIRAAAGDDEAASREAASHLLVSATADMAWGRYADPWRASQIGDAAATGAWTPEAADDLACVYGHAGSHGNAAKDLRVVGATSEYFGAFDLANDAATNGLDLLAADYLHDRLSVDEFAARAAGLWAALNACGGRRSACAPLDGLEQHQAYRRSLLLDDLTPFEACARYGDALDATRGPAYCAAFRDAIHRLPKWTRVLGGSLFAAVAAAAGAAAAWTRRHRGHRVVVNAQPTFLYLVAGGSVVQAGAMLFLGVDDRYGAAAADVACAAAPWCYGVGFALVFGALAAKTERVRRVFAHGRSLRKRVVTVRETLAPAVALVALEVAVLAAWTAADPLRYRRVDSGGDSRGRCASERSWSFMGPILGLHLVCLLWGTSAAYRVRDLDPEYQEASYIFAALYVSLQVALLGVPVLFLVAKYPAVDFLVRCVMLFTTSSSTLGMVFVPKVVLLADQARSFDLRSTRSGTASSSLSTDLSLLRPRSSTLDGKRGDRDILLALDELNGLIRDRQPRDDAREDDGAAREDDGAAPGDHGAALEDSVILITTRDDDDDDPVSPVP